MLRFAVPQAAVRDRGAIFGLKKPTETLSIAW